jgi:hypothetical protein
MVHTQNGSFGRSIITRFPYVEEEEEDAYLAGTQYLKIGHNP